MVILFFPATANPALWANAESSPRSECIPRIFVLIYAPEQTMKIGMLTGGGDCPGLNAVIRAVVRKGIFTYEDELIGFMEGWRGVVEDISVPLDLDAVGGILPRGGTILRTSRTNPSKRPDGLDRCLATLEKNQIGALIAIGG